MVIQRLHRATMLAALVAGCIAATPDMSVAQTCGSTFSVVQRSFKRLDAPNAYVWVDNIESSGSRYKPFQISVVVGSAYPPFKAAEGRLSRSSFDSLMKSAYGVARTNATVSDSALKGGVAVSFTARKQGFVLRVQSVSPVRGGEYSVMLKLCR